MDRVLVNSIVLCCLINFCCVQANVGAVYDLLERVVPGSSKHFRLSLSNATCSGNVEPPCFTVTSAGEKVSISATSVSELSAGLGAYLRDVANVTIGWPRGGGSYVPKSVLALSFPPLSQPLTRRRFLPWSYFMNVCTHSYSLVWYGWQEWEQLIDWMALWGINNVLGLTGQELIQMKVFESFGLTQDQIRRWFNGPAFLTWSRGQNEYGADIAGPLPMSFMQSQWELQRKILARYRSLGIVSQLPAFQGNVPAAMKQVHRDANITISRDGYTGWMDSMDPLYGRIADKWMEVLLEDFGTDHWYQLDGYFNGGTAPWLSSPRETHTGSASADVDPDWQWVARGRAAYMGLNRTDPLAIWAYQGWAIIGWPNDQKHASWLKGFVDATPPGRFTVTGMSVDGQGEWRKWNDAQYFGAHYFWTSLLDFGGDDGLKGNLTRANQLPFGAPEPTATSGLWGSGYTPEGIDNNPVYYSFLMMQAFRSRPVDNLEEWLWDYQLRRYGPYASAEVGPLVKTAWSALLNSAYSQDLSVNDGSGVIHLPGSSSKWAFAPDRRTPQPKLCMIHQAALLLVRAAQTVNTAEEMPEPFRYDLVNTVREVLAQLSTPLSQNFTDACKARHIDRALVESTGGVYIGLLLDLDHLLATDTAFLLGPWIAMARNLAGNATDCPADNFPVIQSCEHFYEWNARVQITTWNPTRSDASAIPGGPVDYAAKQWNGLIGDYYAQRASLMLKQALNDETHGLPLNATALSTSFAQLAYNWTTATKPYATTAVNPVPVAERLLAKYAHYFSECTV